MNLVPAFLLLTALITLVNSAELTLKNRPDRRNQRRERKDRRKLKKHKLKGDPTDLTNLFPQCPGQNADVPALFSGMFLSVKEIDTLVKDTQEEMKPGAARRTKTRYVQKNRMSRKIGTTSKFKSDPDNRSCCETELKVTAPGQVMVDGKSMSVVHMNHSYQYVQEGECVKPGETCRGIGICTQNYKYAFMLLYDPDLVGRVNPPVRYGRVPVKSHCECMNIGRVIK